MQDATEALTTTVKKTGSQIILGCLERIAEIDDDIPLLFGQDDCIYAISPRAIGTISVYLTPEFLRNHAELKGKIVKGKYSSDFVPYPRHKEIARRLVDFEPEWYSIAHLHQDARFADPDNVFVSARSWLKGDHDSGGNIAYSKGLWSIDRHVLLKEIRRQEIENIANNQSGQYSIATRHIGIAFPRADSTLRIQNYDYLAPKITGNNYNAIFQITRKPIGTIAQERSHLASIVFRDFEESNARMNKELEAVKPDIDAIEGLICLYRQRRMKTNQ